VGTLWLIGMMGAGKSTVGMLAAGELGLPFVDLDERVAAEAGMAVQEIFAAEGEDGFRRRERAAVAAVAGTAAVVACGGGVVLVEENVARLRASGRVVWLDAPAAELEDRVAGGAGRPLLSGGAGGLGPILAARSAAYAAAAHCRVETAGRRPGEVTEEVVRLWRAGK